MEAAKQKAAAAAVSGLPQRREPLAPAGGGGGSQAGCEGSGGGGSGSQGGGAEGGACSWLVPTVATTEAVILCRARGGGGSGRSSLEVAAAGDGALNCCTCQIMSHQRKRSRRQKRPRKSCRGQCVAGSQPTSRVNEISVHHGVRDSQEAQGPCGVSGPWVPEQQALPVQRGRARPAASAAQPPRADGRQSYNKLSVNYP